MKMDSRIIKRLVKNVLLSLFIYALPITLMLLAFYLSDERPWIKPTSESLQKPINK
jgi:hypothetical protein